MEVTLPLAFLGGLLSFFSPCFLPIVPAFIGQLVGEPRFEGKTPRINRWIAAGNALGFIAGFSVVFMALWATVAFMGNFVGQYSAIFRTVAGIILMLMGLHVAGIITIAPLNWMWRVPLPGRKHHDEPRSLPDSKPTGPGWGRSALMGVVFASGWTPCIGPILSGILALTTVSTTSLQGISLMAVYCLGLGLPIFLLAIGVVATQEHFGWFRRHHVAVSLVSGGFLVIIGFMMVANLWGKLAGVIPAAG